MAKIEKINVFSLAKFQAVLAAHLGLLAGIIYSFGGLIYDLLTIGLNFGTLLAFMALVGMPLIFAAAGFLLGVFEAILFNLLGRTYGGMKVDF